MTRKKKKPGRTPAAIETLSRIVQRDLHNALSLALIRGRCVLILSDSLVDEASHNAKANVAAITRVDPTSSMRGLQAAWLYFASIEVAMEFWEKRGFSHPQIDELLTDKRRDVLKGFRNAVFHPAPIDDARIAKFYKEWEDVEGWASHVFGLMESYTREWFKEYVRTIPIVGRVD